MLLAAVGDTPYNIVVMVHIIAFLLGFAPAAVAPFGAAHFARAGDEALREYGRFSTWYTSRVSLPALVVLLLTGGALVAMSDDVWSFTDGWLMAAPVVWLAIGGVVSAVILKNERKVGEGNTQAVKFVERGGQIATVLLVVTLYLMIFKPGS